MTRDLEREKLILKKALDLALCMLYPHEPGDSRAVSDQFVALACIQIDDFNAMAVYIIDQSLAVYKAKKED